MTTEESEGLTINVTETSRDPVVAVERKRKFQDEDNQANEEKKKAKKGSSDAHPNKEYISSLFNHNPEIPELLPSSDVCPVKEKVFSSKSFTSAGLHPYLVKNLTDTMNISEMTSVQMKAIPVILSGEDALVKSQTGSGKTLAYALPILHKLQEITPPIQRQSGLYALIIVPTRELAVQSFECFETLCRTFARIVPGIVLGGDKKKSEKARLRKGINILITTPGRFIDHLDHTKCLSLKKLKFLVLDEADRMLELGYEREVQKILTCVSEQAEEQRQTLMLSATLTTGIEQLSEVSMKHPRFVDAAVEEEDQGNNRESMKDLTTPENLKQTFILIPAKLRLVTLAAFILWKCRFSKARKMLIFMATQDMVDFHARIFERCLNHKSKPKPPQKRKNAMTKDAEDLMDKFQGETEEQQVEVEDPDDISLLQLHGSMNQKDRMSVFKKFKESEAGVLLCTDVAARGLDLPQVNWIVQYNPPCLKSDYIHRVGRTARIGAKGSSLLFLLPSEAQFVRQLEEDNLVLAEMTIEQVLEKLYRNSEPSLKTGRLPHTVEEAATNLQMRLETAVTEDQDLHSMSSQAYVSYIRSYASYPREAREVFCFKELHLGHIAKSFGLRDPPNKITGIGKGHWVKVDERKREQKVKEQERKKELKMEEKMINAQKKRINQKALVIDEFQSGLEGIDIIPIKKKKKVGNKHPGNKFKKPKGK